MKGDEKIMTVYLLTETFDNILAILDEFTWWRQVVRLLIHQLDVLSQSLQNLIAVVVN